MVHQVLQVVWYVGYHVWFCYSDGGRCEVGVLKVRVFGHLRTVVVLQFLRVVGEGGVPYGRVRLFGLINLI